MELPRSSSTQKSNSKPVDSVRFLGYSNSKEGIAPDPKHVEKKIQTHQLTTNNSNRFFGLANFYGRMIPDFATKMLPLNNMRNSGFSRGKMQQKAFEDIKNELCANPLVQPYSLQKEATVTTDVSEKAIGRVLSQEGHPVIYVLRKSTPVEQNYSNLEREALSNSFLEYDLPYRLTTNHSNISLQQTRRSRGQHQRESQEEQ